MNEMIERVARAIRSVNVCDVCSLYGEEMPPSRGWPDEFECCAYKAARAAIEAMREPTEAMRKCGHNAGWHGNIDGDAPAEEEAAELLWERMISAALTETPASPCSASSPPRAP